jgi:hypothetical protein
MRAEPFLDALFMTTPEGGSNQQESLAADAAVRVDSTTTDAYRFGHPRLQINPGSRRSFGNVQTQTHASSRARDRRKRCRSVLSTRVEIKS